MNHKSLIVELAEVIARHWPGRSHVLRRLARALAPHPGTFIVTLLTVGVVLFAQQAGALPFRAPMLAGDSTTTISYQGRLANSVGDPITTGPEGIGMQFRLYNTDTGGSSLWEEPHTAVPVEDGLFHVLLGSTNPIPVSLLANNSTLWLGIKVGSDSEMTPREQIASVPYAMQATTLADGAKTAGSLEVRGNLKISNNLLTFADAAGNVYPENWIGVATNIEGTTKWLHIGGVADEGARRIYLGADRIVTYHGARFGIGTTSPSEKLHVIGNILASGSKSAVVNTAHYGQRKLYAAESSEVRFFDEGLARLKDGMARVTLDPVFLETIEGDYLVHVTPYGDASLYVGEIGWDYFVVKVRDGDRNLEFAWRLSAHRKGYAGVRLEEVVSEYPEVAPAVGQP